MTRLMGIICALLWTGVACAQNCPHYAPQDRTEILHLFSSKVIEGTYFGVNGVLLRMSDVAYLASVPKPIVNLQLLTQRQAFENEYRALVQLLNQLGKQSARTQRPKTRAFLAGIINADYLGLTGTTLNGGSDEEALQNSQRAVAKINAAMEKLWQCF